VTVKPDVVGPGVSKFSVVWELGTVVVVVDVVVVDVVVVDVVVVEVEVVVVVSGGAE
jgi:hypothetical protein